MERILNIIILVVLCFSCSCKKTGSTSQIVCSNLLNRGVADTVLFEGKWGFEYFAYTFDGNGITQNDSAHVLGYILFNNGVISGTAMASIKGSYNITSPNNLSIQAASTEYRELFKTEKRVQSALNNSLCYALKNDTLLIHYTEDGNSKNVLILRRM